MKIPLQLERVIGTIAAYHVLVVELRLDYQRVALFNAIIVLLSHREMLDVLLRQIKENEYDEKTSFTIDLALKKTWDRHSNSISVSVGDMSIDYGMCYSGFTERLFVLPITERAYLAMCHVFREGAVVVLTGATTSGKSTLSQELAYSLGADAAYADCRLCRSAEDIHRYIQAAIGCGLWLTFKHTDQLQQRDHQLLLTLMGSLLEVKSALGGKMDRVTIGNIQLIPSSRAARFTLLFNGTFAAAAVLPMSLQDTFRPIYLLSPNMDLVFRAVAGAYLMPQPEILGVKLHSIMEHLISSSILNRSQAMCFTVEALKEIGYCNIIDPINPSKLPLMLFVDILKSIPMTARRYLSINEMELVCKLYLDASFDDGLRTMNILLANPLHALDSIAAGKIHQEKPNSILSELSKDYQISSDGMSQINKSNLPNAAMFRRLSISIPDTGDLSDQLGEFKGIANAKKWDVDGLTNQVSTQVRRITLDPDEMPKEEQKEQPLVLPAIMVPRSLKRDASTEDIQIQQHRTQAIIQIRDALCSPGFSSLVISGPSACGKSSLLRMVAADINQDTSLASNKIEFFPHIVHPNVILLCKRFLSTDDVFAFFIKLEKLLEDYGNKRVCVVIFDSFDIGILLMLPEWLASLVFKGIKKQLFFIWECSSYDLTHTCPSSLYSSVFVAINEPSLYTRKEIYSFLMDFLFTRSTSVMKTWILSVVSRYIESFIDLFPSVDTFRANTLVINTLNVVSSLYYNAGLERSNPSNAVSVAR